MPIHESDVNFVATGLASANHMFDLGVADNAYASATTLALWQAVNSTRQTNAAVHETERSDFDIANRTMATMNAMATFTTTEMAAANTQSLTQDGFVDNDARLAKTFRGCRGL